MIGRKINFSNLLATVRIAVRLNRTDKQELCYCVIYPTYPLEGKICRLNKKPTRWKIDITRHHAGHCHCQKIVKREILFQKQPTWIVLLNNKPKHPLFRKNALTNNNQDDWKIDWTSNQDYHGQILSKRYLVLETTYMNCQEIVRKGTLTNRWTPRLTDELEIETKKTILTILLQPKNC